MTRRAAREALARATVVALILGVSPGVTSAQVTDTTQTPVDSVVVTPGANPTLMTANDTTPAEPMTPRGAFIRSLIIPGWGQAAFESYTRGGIYFMGWAGNWFMNFRNYVRLDAAREMFDRRAAQIEAGLITGSENPDSMRTAIQEDPGILDAAITEDDGEGFTAANLRQVVSSREQQREDWIALTIFWLLASGVDAYVNAHLADQPTGIELRRNPDRSYTVGLRVPLPGRAP